MTIANEPRNIAELVRGARGIFVFHSAVLASWVLLQVYYRLAQSIVLDAGFWFGLLNWILIAAAPFFLAYFARGLRGTRAAPFGYFALALALVDFVAETLQFAPHFGVPALIPNDEGISELIVRGLWGTCEFAMRSAVFVALWRCQVGSNKLVWHAFFTLVVINWAAAMVTFLRATEPYAAWWSAVPAAEFARFSWVLAMCWMSLLVWLSHCVASSRRPALVEAALSR